MALLVPVVILALMWVVLILPQQRRVKAHATYVASLSVGDAVITTAGLYGTITAIGDDTVELAIAPGVVVTVARLAVGRPQDDATTPPEQAANDPLSSDPSDTTE